MALKTSEFDAAAYLTDDESIVEFVSGVAEMDDPRFVGSVLEAVIRVRGGAVKIAGDADLSEDVIDRAVAGEPGLSFATLNRVLASLGLAKATPRAA